MIAYWALCHSVMSYGIIAWGNSAKAEKNFVMQWRTVRGPSCIDNFFHFVFEMLQIDNFYQFIIKLRIYDVNIFFYIWEQSLNILYTTKHVLNKNIHHNFFMFINKRWLIPYYWEAVLIGYCKSNVILLHEQVKQIFIHGEVERMLSVIWVCKVSAWVVGSCAHMTAVL